jgi:hypothetical protein
MGAPNPDRMMRLRSLRTPGQGFVWLAVCEACGHTAGLPVRQLLARYGELFPVETAMRRMRCGECDGARVVHRLARLCEPGCRYWRQ